MNKKLFLGMFAAAGMLLATSCSNDELDGALSGKEATISFNLGVEDGVQSRAISDASGANRLVYAVFDKNGKRITTIAKVDEPASFPTERTITLAKGQTYKVAFWAQNKNCGAYVLDDAMNLTVDYEDLNNEEDRDAFFKTVEFTVTGHTKIDVVLRRPFAQLNVGVNTGDDDKDGTIDAAESNGDWEYAVASGITIKESKVVIKNVADKMDLVTGKVSMTDKFTGEVDYDFGTIPAKFSTGEEWLEVDTDGDGTKEHYKYLSMSYFLVNDINPAAEGEVAGAGRATVDDVVFTFRPESGNDIVFNSGLNDVPVQRNWRTNIIGQILTGNIQFNITIDKNYDGEINGENNGDENGTTYQEHSVRIGDKYYKTIEDALKDAVDKDVIHLGAAEDGYTLPGSIKLKDNATGTITFAGEGDKTVIRGCANASGMDIIMKDLKWTSPNKGYDTAFIHANSVKFENCNITGQYYAQSLAPHTFISCTIEPQSGYLYTYAANCTFESCTFNSSKGKALQVYTDGTTGESTVNINNCTFIAETTATTWDGKPVTAIDINSMGHKFTVNINNSTATGYATGLYSGSSMWNIKGGEEYVTVNIDSKQVNDAVELNGVKYGTLAAALAVAVDNDVIKLEESTYVIPETAKGKTLTFEGTGKAAETVIECKIGTGVLNGSIVTFKNLTIETANGNYQGFQHIAKATYEDCIIKNMYTLYGPSEFTECTFAVEGDVYNVWTYGTNSTFDKCTFNCDGKAVYVYNEGKLIDDTVTFKECVFNDYDGLEDETKAAIETGANYETVKHTIIIKDCTVNGFNVTSDKTKDYNWGGDSFGTNVWGNKYLMHRDNLNVIINDEEVY